jgi:hypothetical protein
MAIFLAGKIPAELRPDADQAEEMSGDAASFDALRG